MSVDYFSTAEFSIDDQRLWIHCFRCYQSYVHKQRLFYLLTCKHVVCHDCAPPQPKDDVAFEVQYHKCPECGKMGRGQHLGMHTPPHIKELFHPLQDALPHERKHRILDFQRMHLKHFQQGMQRMKHRYNKQMENLEKARTETRRKKFEELEELRRERKLKEQRTREIIEKKKELGRKRVTFALPASQSSSADDDSFLIFAQLASSNVFNGSPTAPQAATGQGPSQPREPAAISPDTDSSEELPSFAHLNSNSFVL